MSATSSPPLPPEPPSRGSGGLRQRHKLATRRLLEDTALRLFARDGFDATTVEAIATEAGVSARTFFRYFAGKDEVLSPDRQERQARLREAVLASALPPSASGLDVAVDALLSIAPTFEAERPTMELRRQAAISSPVLRGRSYDVLHTWERTIVAALAERRSTPRHDLRAETAGAVAATLWQHAIQRWLLDEDATAGLAEHLRRAREALEPAADR